VLNGYALDTVSVKCRTDPTANATSCALQTSITREIMIFFGTYATAAAALLFDRARWYQGQQVSDSETEELFALFGF